ncbi:MAG TPA: anthranilate phosphoribosyltransferase [bacterium]|nr:anthranilate phosphoribosyltransferase [bacterium]HEX68190.1 anthranilate phosphoribosyltransferase [bacterium]
MKEILEKLSHRENLTPQEMKTAMELIMEGEATPAQIGAFLMGLKTKGETVEEITEGVRVMQEKALRIFVENREEGLVDTCGTGGDGKNTFNISTVTAFVVAGAGIKVAKHGNRGVSSSCGSADVLEKLGVKIELTPEDVKKCIEEIGIGFIFAPCFHPAMKYATPVRRELGMRTIFNILGPLSNPAKVNIQLMGVYDPSLLLPLIHVLKNLGHLSAMVVHSQDGYDEITLTSLTQVYELKNGDVRGYFLFPENLGFEKCSPRDLEGGTVEENAEIMKGILNGTISGPKRDVVLLNAGAVIYLAGKAGTLKEGVKMAEDTLLSGKAKEKLETLIEFTQSLK